MDTYIKFSRKKESGTEIVKIDLNKDNPKIEYGCTVPNIRTSEDEKYAVESALGTLKWEPGMHYASREAGLNDLPELILFNEELIRQSGWKKDNEIGYTEAIGSDGNLISAKDFAESITETAKNKRNPIYEIKNPGEAIHYLMERGFKFVAYE